MVLAAALVTSRSVLGGLLSDIKGTLTTGMNVVMRLSSFQMERIVSAMRTSELKLQNLVTSAVAVLPSFTGHAVGLQKRAIIAETNLHCYASEFETVRTEYVQDLHNCTAMIENLRKQNQMEQTEVKVNFTYSTLRLKLLLLLLPRLCNST